jgi:exonuclease SbcC
MDENVESAATELSRGRESLSGARDLLRRLREGREAWGRQQSHRMAFERLIAEVDASPNSMRDQIRAAVGRKLDHAEQNARATALSKEVASKASTAIATAVSEFNAEYIEPLDRLTKSINQAILCDSRIGIDLHVNRKTIKQSAKRDGELPPKRKIDPMLVHSEGQMAALAVSMLCAASLTYPWSRWRALILDDPLQHNDAIHAAAFADMVANLVQAKDYQILLSTHDLGQADFLRRKFEARKIPCAVLNLLGRGKAGVETEFVPSGIGGSAMSVSA